MALNGDVIAVCPQERQVNSEDLGTWNSRGLAVRAAEASVMLSKLQDVEEV